MLDRPKLKLHAAFFFACYPASCGLFVAAHALHGAGWDSIKIFICLLAVPTLGVGLLGLTAIGSIVISRWIGQRSAVDPSGLMLPPIAFLSWASLPTIFGADAVSVPGFVAAFGHVAPLLSGCTAHALIASHIRGRRLWGLPAARLVR